MKRLLCILLACILLAGCSSHSKTAAGSAKTASGSSTEATKPAPSGAVETMRPITSDTGEEMSMNAIPESIRALLPGFPVVSASAAAVSYRGVTDQMCNDYVNQMEAKGFRAVHGQDRELLYREDCLLDLQKWNDENQGVTLQFHEAAEGAAPVDVERLNEMLQDAPNDRTGYYQFSTDKATSYSGAGALICALTVSPTEVREQTGLERCVVAMTDPDLGYIIREVLVSECGAAYLTQYLGPTGMDPVCADLDKDGTAEYIFWGSGPTSGLFTVALWAYGVEEDMPVVKGTTILNLSYCDGVRLELDGGEAIFPFRQRIYDPVAGTYRDSDIQRLTLSIRNGQLLLNDGELPKGIENWGGGSFGVLGGRLSDVRAAAKAKGSELLCETWLSVTRKRSMEDGSVLFEAAFSRDGIRVAGAMTRLLPSQGSESKANTHCVGFTPIAADPDLDALVGLSNEELIARLGPALYDEGSGLYLFRWWTEDGEILNVSSDGNVLSASLFDPLTGSTLRNSSEGVTGDADVMGGPDDVSVSQGRNSCLYTPERWETFVANTQAGKPDEVNLWLYFEEGVFQLRLRYDGDRYYLTDEGRENSYACLICSEETDPPLQATYTSAVHWILSDDPDMTYRRYFAQMVSSRLVFDFPNTRGLFSTYEKKEN